MMPATNVGGSGRGLLMVYKKRRMKKCLLWTLLVAQIGLIFCLWCMQIGYTEHKVNDKDKMITTTTQMKPIKAHFVASMEKIKASPLLLSIQGRVNFVTKTKRNSTTATLNRKASQLHSKKLNFIENVSNFSKDFAEIKTQRLINLTGIEADMMEQGDYGGIESEMSLSNIWCFKRGTLIDDADTDDAGLQIFWNANAQRIQCKCRPNWHGKDCAQNEVIYRALLLPPHNQFTLRDPLATKKAHFLVYMLEGSFSSLDLLQLQIKSVVNVVDYFLIFWHTKQQQQPEDFKKSKAFKQKLVELLTPAQFTLYECVNNKSSSSSSLVHASTLGCNRDDAFAFFQKDLSTKFKRSWLQPNDLLLHTNENVLLSADALRFFKYYAPQSAPWPISGWRFRLKYNVYGFFWQHPDKTYLDGYLSSLGQTTHVSWPVQLRQFLLKTNNNNNNDIAIANNYRILGDLNHYCGWYCQYCAPPDEIIDMLNQLELSAAANILPPTARANDFINLPKNSRNNLVIDTKYMEYLIAQGLHIDGKTHLLKNRINSNALDSAYYAPAYAEKLKWKFGNLLKNLFEAMENDYVLDEAEGGFGF